MLTYFLQRQKISIGPDKTTSVFDRVISPFREDFVPLAKISEFTVLGFSVIVTYQVGEILHSLSPEHRLES